MIRVLHSVSNMDRAGIETMLMNYYRHMDRSLVQFDFLCNKKKPGAYDEEIRGFGGRIFHTPGLNPFKYLDYLKYMNILFKRYPEYKIVEAHNGALGVYALHGAKRNHVPYRIFHAHGASITKDWKLPIKLVCKFLLPFNMNLHFSCGVAAAECYFGKRIVKAEDYKLIPNAIEVERFVFDADIRNKIRDMYGLQDKKVIGHVGRFMKQKNHEYLIDVFSELYKKDTQYHLVLLGDGELESTIKTKVKKLGLEHQVTFMGNVDNTNEWYQAFDCFVLPSVWEGLPVVGVEAQAADLPCIFSANITREIGFSDKCKFVPISGEIDFWVQAIEEAIKNPVRQDATELIRKNHYDISYEAIKLQQIYMELAGEK